MVAGELKERLAEVAAGFAEVSLAYLFGSEAAGTAGPGSDVDVAVLLKRGSDAALLREKLALAWQAAVRHRPVQVVILNKAPLEWAYAVIAAGVVLYERDLATRVEYEAEVLSRYGDYLPVLREQRREILTEGPRAARIQWHREALGRTLGALEQVRGAPGQKPRRV
jgi:predicted nucleotidyltransferase